MEYRRKTMQAETSGTRFFKQERNVCSLEQNERFDEQTFSSLRVFCEQDTSGNTLQPRQFWTIPIHIPLGQDTRSKDLV